MHSVPAQQRARKLLIAVLIFLISLAPMLPLRCLAQEAVLDSSRSKTTASLSSVETPSEFRCERLPVGNEGELLTIFGNLSGVTSSAQPSAASSEVPLVSVLRDTLGDSDPANDLLRDVWMHTYTRPTKMQRLAATVPFFYRRIGNKKEAEKKPPKPVLDLARADRDVWQRFFWSALQTMAFDPYGAIVRASTRTHRRNLDDYRKAHILRALAVLSLYEAQVGVTPALTSEELREVQARLMLTETTFGGIVDDIHLQRAYQKQTTVWRDTRGHNWEMLRQRAETEGLYFDPLELPDSEPTHALLWVPREDLNKQRERKFDARFLNIADPWQDHRLHHWTGYTETRYFDAEHRTSAPDAPGARGVEMIPLALYGLDHPRVPILLVDFRHEGNPHRREMSRRVIEDIARNLLSISRFGDLHYLLGRFVYDFVTGRRGMDINQPSRLRAYSQLKLLLALSASLDPELRAEVGRRLERVTLNPLMNDLKTETQLAREQYAQLREYALRSDGLAARLKRDRQAELTTERHNAVEQVFFRVANLLSFDLYTHREKETAKMRSELDEKRRFARHKRFLREVAASSSLVEVVWNIEEVRNSLRFVSSTPSLMDRETIRAASKIFIRTRDDATRELCFNYLQRSPLEAARKELARIAEDKELDGRGRQLLAEYLRAAPVEKPSTASRLPTGSGSSAAHGVADQ